MKIIFLDIDGVLNSKRSWTHECVQVGRLRSHRMSPHMIYRLKALVETTGAKIVISSTWRLIYPLPAIEKMLMTYGIPIGTIIGATPRYGRRHHEISGWIKLNKELVSDYVILDDDEEAEPAGFEWMGEGGGQLHRNHFVQTKWEDGMQGSHVIAAKKILDGGSGA